MLNELKLPIKSLMIKLTNCCSSTLWCRKEEWTIKFIGWQKMIIINFNNQQIVWTFFKLKYHNFMTFVQLKVFHINTGTFTVTWLLCACVNCHCPGKVFATDIKTLSHIVFAWAKWKGKKTMLRVLFHILLLFCGSAPTHSTHRHTERASY